MHNKLFIEFRQIRNTLFHKLCIKIPLRIFRHTQLKQILLARKEKSL